MSFNMASFDKFPGDGQEDGGKSGARKRGSIHFRNTHGCLVIKAHMIQVGCYVFSNGVAAEVGIFQ